MTARNDIEKLFKAHYAQMFRLAMAFLHDAEASRDIVHDVFASLLTSGQKDIASAGNKEDEKLSAGYLLASVRNRCLNLIRDNSIRDRIANLYFIDNNEYDTENWPDDETIAQIYQIIKDDLTPQCRRVMELRFIHGLKFAKVAEKINISENAVYKHVRQALIIIRTKLSQNG